VDLSGAYNREGLTADGAPFTGGGLDGTGVALSADLLHGSQSWRNTTFSLGPTGSANAVSAAGQTIDLPAGSFSYLRFLATAVNGNQPDVTFTVTYADGSTDTFTRSISDWTSPQNYAGEAVAVTMPYRNAADGSQDSGTFSLYGYELALDGSKQVQSITLPNNGNVMVLAMTLVS
jgi:hypothetical protein